MSAQGMSNKKITEAVFSRSPLIFKSARETIFTSQKKSESGHPGSILLFFTDRAADGRNNIKK